MRPGNVDSDYNSNSDFDFDNDINQFRHCEPLRRPVSKRRGNLRLIEHARSNARDCHGIVLLLPQKPNTSQ